MRLELLGEHIPGHPGTAHVMAELARTKLALAGRSIDKLRALPRMTDPRKVVAMRILMLSTAPAYFENQNLLPLVSLRMVRLSVRYGNAAHSAYGYAMYGLVLCGVLNDMRRGLAFGRLALDAIDLFDARVIFGRVSMVFGGFILHWNGRLADTLPYFTEGANAALEAGDLEFHGYNRYAYASYAFMSGTPLDRVADILEAGYAAVLQHKHEKTQRVFRMARQAVRELRGRAAAPANPDEAPFAEAAEVAYWTDRDRMALAYYYEFRLLKQYMARDFEGCVASARVIDENFNVVMGMAFSVYYLLYQSLALIALLPKMTTASARWRALRTVRRNQGRLRTWSRHAPDNYRHKWLLVEAELARLRGSVMQAEQAYEQAIALAGRYGALPDEALANRAGRRIRAGARPRHRRPRLPRRGTRCLPAVGRVGVGRASRATPRRPVRSDARGRQRARTIIADRALFERNEGAARRRRHHSGSRRDLGQDPGRRCRRRSHRGLGHERRRDARPAAPDARRRVGHPG